MPPQYEICFALHLLEFHPMYSKRTNFRGYLLDKNKERITLNFIASYINEGEVSQSIRLFQKLHDSYAFVGKTFHLNWLSQELVPKHINSFMMVTV